MVRVAFVAPLRPTGAGASLGLCACCCSRRSKTGADFEPGAIIIDRDLDAGLWAVLADGIKSKELKEGVAATIDYSRSGSGGVLKQIRLGNSQKSVQVAITRPEVLSTTSVSGVTVLLTIASPRPQVAVIIA